MKIVFLEYKEAHPDWAKHGSPPFYIDIKLDESELPYDTSWRNDGVCVWRDKLASANVFPDSIQRLEGSMHNAYLFWHDRSDALKTFEKLQKLRGEL